MFKLEMKFSDDLTSAAIKFPEQIDASADDLAELIRAFVSVRAQMKPAVPMTSPPQTGVEDFTNNPLYLGLKRSTAWGRNPQIAPRQFRLDGFLDAS